MSLRKIVKAPKLEDYLSQLPTSSLNTIYDVIVNDFGKDYYPEDIKSVIINEICNNVEDEAKCKEAEEYILGLDSLDVSVNFERFCEKFFDDMLAMFHRDHPTNNIEKMELLADLVSEGGFGHNGLVQKKRIDDEFLDDAMFHAEYMATVQRRIDRRNKTSVAQRK